MEEIIVSLKKYPKKSITVLLIQDTLDRILKKAENVQVEKSLLKFSVDGYEVQVDTRWIELRTGTYYYLESVAGLYKRDQQGSPVVL